MMTDENSQLITVENAKKLAEQDAYSELKSFIQSTSDEVLDSHYLEAEYCWIFFKNPQIIVPDYALLGIKWAYAVSKKGNRRMVYDLRDDSEKMKNHLENLSNYFKEKGE